MFVERGIPSVMRAKKVVIAGDHKQLRPSKLGAGRIGMDEDDAEATTSGDVVQPLRVDRLTRTASRMTRIFFISITSLLKFVASS